MKIFSRNKERLLTSLMIVHSILLILINLSLIEKEKNSNNSCSIYLALELILCGSLIIITLPLYCYSRQALDASQASSNGFGASSTGSNQMRIMRQPRSRPRSSRSDGVSCPDHPPKYSEIFPWTWNFKYKTVLQTLWFIVYE